MEDENKDHFNKNYKDQLRKKITEEIIPIFSNYFWGIGGFKAIIKIL